MIEPLTAQPVFQADRFDLRPLRRSDRGLLDMYMGDERIAKQTRAVPHPMPPGAVDAFIARSNHDDRSEDIWALDGTKSGLAELLGVMTVNKLDRDQCEIEYWVAPAFWNTGFASEAVRTIVEANPFGAKTIFAEVFQSNGVSARVLTNAGFAYLGDAEAYSVAQDRTVQTWTYSRKID